MKKITLITVLLGFIISSCSKRADDIVMPQANTQADASNAVLPEILYTWAQLPSDLKDAAVVNAAATDKYPVQSFGPYGTLTGTGFSSFPPTGSKIYAMGFNYDAVGLTKIITWYKGTDNKIYYYGAGTSNNFYLQRFSDDEYINKITVYSNNLINKLTIATNKKTFSYGTGGTLSKDVYAPGSQFLAFWGRSGTSYIDQLYFGAYVRTWTLLPGSDSRDIAVGNDGTAYMTNIVGKIYKFSNNSWMQIVGSDGRTIAANAGRVAMVNTVGKIYEYFGNAWVQLPGSDGKDIAINSDGKIWMLNTAGKIYRYNESNWELISSNSSWISAPSRIAAGAGQVWMADATSHLYKLNGSVWELQPGITALDVAVGSDGIVWVVNPSRIVYNYYNGKWISKGASSGANISANNKTAFLAQSTGSIRNLAY